MSFGPGRDGAPSWTGVLPGRPAPFRLPRGEGERSVAFDALTTVLLSAAETENQFGMFVVEQPAGPRIPTHRHAAVHETFYVVEGSIEVFVAHRDGQQERLRLGVGDFAYVPAGITHAFEATGERNTILGSCTAGFERFFQALGRPTEERGIPSEPYMVPREQLADAFARYDNIPQFDFTWEV